MFRIILMSLGLILSTSLVAQDLSQLNKEKPFRWAGSLSLSSGMYAAQGIDPRGSQFQWRISGTPTLYIYGIQLPFNFTIGREVRSFNYPVFNQFGVSPNYKWIKIHAGYRNLTFSPYTLAGHTFLGGGIELTPGKFRLSAMAGRLRDAIVVDSNSIAQQPTFRRMGYGVKVGVGSNESYIDLIFFGGKDDPNSLNSPADSAITASQNIVTGITTRYKISNAFSFDGDIAISAFTRNLNSTIIETDSLPHAEYIPSEVFQPTISTRANMAGKAGLMYSKNNFSLRLGFEHIDPEYESMGAYFFANDLENITISPSLILFKGKVRTSGSYGWQHNNLYANRSEQSSRQIGSFNLSVNPNPFFGVDAAFSNFRSSQVPVNLELTDSIRLAMVSSYATLTPRFTIMGERSVQSVFFNAYYQYLDDQNPFTQQYGDVRTTLLMVSHTIAFKSSQLSIQSGLNYQNTALAFGNSRRYGFNGNVGKPFLKNKLNLQANFVYTFNTVNDVSDGTTLQLGANINYQMSKKHSFFIRLNLLNNQSETYKTFTEFRGNIGYTWRLK